MSVKRMVTDFAINTLIFAFICTSVLIFKTVLYKNEKFYANAVIITKPIDVKYYKNFSTDDELFDAITKRSLGKVERIDTDFFEGSFSLKLSVKDATSARGGAVIFSGVYMEYESFSEEDL